MNIEGAASRELKRMEEVFSSLNVVKECELLTLAESYFKDSKYFIERAQYIEAFECAVISWAYIDALLHLGYVEVPEHLKQWFTVK